MPGNGALPLLKPVLGRKIGSIVLQVGHALLLEIVVGIEAFPFQENVGFICHDFQGSIQLCRFALSTVSQEQSVSVEV